MKTIAASAAAVLLATIAPQEFASAGPVRPHKYIFANTTVIQVCSDTVIRVARVPVAGNLTAVDERVSLIAQRDWEPVTPTVTSSGGVTNITTSNIVVVVEEATGNVTFYDTAGKLVLAETGHQFEPTVDIGHATYSVQQEWAISPTESLCVVYKRV